MRAERFRSRAQCGRVVSWSLALAIAGCGVREYLQGPKATDVSDDFAPTTYRGNAPAKRHNDGGMNELDRAEAGIQPDAQAVDPLPDAAIDAGATSGVSEPSALEPTTIVLGGVQLRKQDVIAFLHFGHSNMAGRATTPADERPFFFTETDPGAWMYHVGKMPELAKEPETAGDTKSFNRMQAGPGTALLKLARERAPDKYFMSLGFGHSGATCENFLPGGLHHESAIRAALAVKDRVTIGATILMLGISETNAAPETRSQFAQCVRQLIDEVREALRQPDLPVLLSDYERGATGVYAPDGEFGRTMIAQIAMVPGLVSNCVIIPTDGIEMEDDHHFNLTGHKVWSGRALNLMQAHGWFPAR